MHFNVRKLLHRSISPFPFFHSCSENFDRSPRTMARDKQLSTSTTSTTKACATNASDRKSGYRSKDISNRNVTANNKPSAKQDTALTVIRKKPKSGTSIKLLLKRLDLSGVYLKYFMANEI